MGKFGRAWQRLSKCGQLLGKYRIVLTGHEGEYGD